MRPLPAVAAAVVFPALLAACDYPIYPEPYSVRPTPTVVEPVVATPVAPVTVTPVAPMTPPPPPEPVASVPGDTCGAAGLQTFVGSIAPQPFPAAGPVRVYAQGDPVTMDHNPERVNVVVNPQDRRRIVSISCG